MNYNQFEPKGMIPLQTSEGTTAGSAVANRTAKDSICRISGSFRN